MNEKFSMLSSSYSNIQWVKKTEKRMVKGEHSGIDLEKNILSARYRKDTKSFEREFANFGYVELPNFLRASVFESIRREVMYLEKFSKKRDFNMVDYNTPRRLSTLGGNSLANLSPLLCKLYSHVEIRSFVQKIVREDIRNCQHSQEWMVINFLKSQQSTHGWHLDDPPYALVLVVEMQGSGGLVEIIPAWAEFCQKQNLKNLRDRVEIYVEKARQENLVHSKHFKAGTAYILHASQCLHRVSELTTEDSCRMALNMAFEGRADVFYGSTADFLYG